MESKDLCFKNSAKILNSKICWVSQADLTPRFNICFCLYLQHLDDLQCRASLSFKRQIISGQKYSAHESVIKKLGDFQFCQKAYYLHSGPGCSDDSIQNSLFATSWCAFKSNSICIAIQKSPNPNMWASGPLGPPTAYDQWMNMCSTY